MLSIRMPWYGKEQASPFENTPITGLEFLHGDVLAKRYRQQWVEGKKYPLITFPSGLQRELRQSASTADEQQVHIFGEMSLPYQAQPEEAYQVAQKLATEHGYQVAQVSNHRLRLANPRARRIYEVTFDEQRGFLANIAVYPPHAMELLTGEGRAVLPPLYHNEPLGLEAVAPLKFFTPDSGWTWYPTEFDGDDIFFGLVSGLDVELGYFALSELEGVRGKLGLPIERDLFFEPKTLRELKHWHEENGN